ncbi:MAG: DUF881 domain-containing protein [Micromonosporaceae bacterium]|nr:DUF881 domain-containing protein [Micromonosporaceae bacterium]
MVEVTSAHMSDQQPDPGADQSAADPAEPRAEPDRSAAPDHQAEPDRSAAPDHQAEPDRSAVPDHQAEPDRSAVPDHPALPETKRRRISAAGAMIGLLLGLLGFALVVQLHGNTPDEQLETARTEDLVRILADLDARETRLREEISDLEASRRRLESGAQGKEAALAEARRRADEIGILAGTLPAEGPGLTIGFAPVSEPIRASVLLDAVQELRGAGAEAMEIEGAGGTTVRIVASTYLVDAEDGVMVGGAVLGAPYILRVIGDPQTMRTALQIPGGVIDNVQQRGGTVSVNEGGTISISTLHHGEGLRYARPVQ